MFSFGLSSVISKVFVADFEHVFVCSNPKIPFPAIKYLIESQRKKPKNKM